MILLSTVLRIFAKSNRWIGMRSPILTMLVAFLLFSEASALPLHLGLFLLPANTAAMTHGCEKGTCCTALCYLDKHGVHHCVHMAGDSCECGVSTDDCAPNGLFLSAIVCLPEIESLLPDLVPNRWMALPTALFEGRQPATPTPPPKG